MTALALGLVGWAAALAAWARMRRREVLVARACHELRGPLTAARLGLRLIAHGATEPLPAVELELVRAAHAIEDLAAAPAGRRVADRPELVDMGGLVADTVAGWRAFAERHGAWLTFAPPAREAWVWGDPTRLAQACGNLLANAAEHGGGAVGVAVRVREGRVLVDVEDGGPGLDASVAALTRRARRRRGPRGHGLGVAAAVAARHGGRLAAAPSPRGARLVLEIPAVDAAAAVADAGR